MLVDECDRWVHTRRACVGIVLQVPDAFALASPGLCVSLRRSALTGEQSRGARTGHNDGGVGPTCRLQYRGHVNHNVVVLDDVSTLSGRGHAVPNCQLQGMTKEVGHVGSRQ